MAVTLVSGVPGVGASTVCERARQRLDDDHQLVNFHDAMLEQAVTLGMAERRADLSALTARETRRLQRRAGEYVADRSEVRDVLLNTYLAVETTDGYLTGLAADALDGVVPERFVLLEAAPETIVERRRESDRTHDDSVREVRFQQELNRTATASFAAETRSPVRHVENEGSVDEAASRLVDSLREA
jgi:adenylate kinase